MHDFDRWLLEEYLRVTGKLAGDRAELARRLARRRTALLVDPPRAWCLAVRASDTRITPSTAVIWPKEALGVENEISPGRMAEHSVVLDGRLLEELCRPVTLLPYMDWVKVAKELGVHCESLRYAMRKGFFDVKYVKGISGKHGPPVPLIYTDATLDPSSGNMHRASDPLWGAVWQWAAASVPKGLSQVVRRRPNYRKYRDEERFRGWYWICPGCGRGARTMFYPLPRYTIPKFLEKDLAEEEADAMPEAAGCFACLFCHRVKYFTRLGTDAWNYFIAHVTGGLVYGREIARPAWMTEAARSKVGRQRRPVHGADTPRARATAARRGEILARLLRGELYRTIASEMGIAQQTISGHASRIYREHRVHGRRELVELLGAGRVEVGAGVSGVVARAG
jgi:DNA-binding CsgD family transcriptional regulator